MTEEVPGWVNSWLKVEDEEAIPRIGDIPFWEWSSMPQSWRDEHKLPPTSSYYERPTPQVKKAEPVLPPRRRGRPFKHEAAMRKALAEAQKQAAQPAAAAS